MSALCKRNFLRCQLSGSVPLQPPYDSARDENDRCRCRNGPTCDPLRPCDARDLRLIALKGLLLFLAFGFLARGRERDELLDIGNCQVTGVCEQRVPVN